MSDVLTITDLEIAKKHDTFHSEVITGKAGGLAGGANIDSATNAATGQVQTTLPKVLRDVGFKPASFNFVTGGTLGVADTDKCIYNPAPAGDDNWYSWSGSLPHTVAPGADPTLPGSGYVPRTDSVLRTMLASSSGASLVGYGSGTVKSSFDYIMMSYPLDATDYLPDGYMTDGSVSYTAELQQAFNDAAGLRTVLLPNFPVLIDPAGTLYGGLQVPSNSKIVWRPSSSLKIKANDLQNYEVIGIRDKQNVELFNPTIYGDKYTHAGTAGEFGMGIAIRGACDDIKIHYPRIYECWGDGIYIGQTANTVDSTPKNVHIINPVVRRCRRQSISVTSADGLFITNPGFWDTKSSDCATPLPNGPHAGIDIEPNGSFSMLRNIRITGMHGGGNDAGLFYIFLGAITNTASDPYHVDITVDGLSDDGSSCAVQLTGLNKDASYSGSVKISNVSSDNAKLNGIRARDWPIKCGLHVDINGVSISDWVSSVSEPARSRAPISLYTTDAGFPKIGNLSIKGITLRQSRDASTISERAFHGENAANGVSNVLLEFDSVQSTKELQSLSDGSVKCVVTGDYGSGLTKTLTASSTLPVGETCDYIVAPSGANPTITLPVFSAMFIGQVRRFKYVGGGTSTYFRLRTALGIPMYVNSVSGTNFIFDKSSGVVELTYADGAFVVRCDGAYTKES